MTRARPPERRHQVTVETSVTVWLSTGAVQTHPALLSIGQACRDDGSLGPPVEVFAAVGDVGSQVEATYRDAAIAISVAVQFGATIETLRAAVTRDQEGRAASAIGALLDALAGPWAALAAEVR